MKFIVAVCDTMWDWRGQTSGDGLKQAPRYFRINKNNFTGRRLYDLIGSGNSLIVTEACKELVSSPKEHGTPDPVWLSQNLQILSHIRSIDVLLVCGHVARNTWRDVKLMKETLRWYDPRMIEVNMHHPAARNVWTRDYTDSIKRQIQGGNNGR